MSVINVSNLDPAKLNQTDSAKCNKKDRLDVKDVTPDDPVGRVRTATQS